MSVDSVLDEALTLLLAKAQRPLVEAQRQPIKPATLNFDFLGGGAPIVLANCDPLKLVIPYPGRIIWARLSAGDALGAPVAVSATVDITLTQFETFGGVTPLYATGSIPTLNAEYKAELSLTGWQTDLLTGDWLIARLASYTGTATWVSLDLLYRPTDAELGAAGMVDDAGDSYVDASGNRYVIRR